MRRGASAFLGLAGGLLVYMSWSLPVRHASAVEPASAGRAATALPGAIPNDEPAAPPPASGDTVTVVHDWVEIVPSRAAAGVSASLPVPRRAPALRTPASTSARIRGGTADEPCPDPPRLVSRAARLIVGDGRHRPEPFPRPSN